MHQSTRLSRIAVVRWLSTALVMAGTCNLLGAGFQVDRKVIEEAQRKQARAAHDPGAMEVRFNDNSTMKLWLREDKIELLTPYGKLTIPVSDIQRIDVGLRIPEEAAKRIEKAISDLASPQFRARETASEELVTYREKAYPSLLQATQQSDPEVARRAEKVLTKLRDALPAEMLDVPGHDTVYTATSKIAGHIGATTLRIHTYQFGELQVKLADVRTFRSLRTGDGDLHTILPDPGTLVSFASHIGKTFVFRVTGATEGNLWGTGLHTLDSSLPKAAVHAGILKPGQTGTVRVTILPPQQSFQGSNQNGVISSSYGPYQGSYRIERGD